MKKLLLSLTVLVVLMVANSVQAAPPLQEPVGESYFIESGGTVGAISADIFGDPRYYPVVVAYNNGYAACDPSVQFITDANRVTVGQKIIIPDSTISSVTGTGDPYGTVIGELPLSPFSDCGDAPPGGDFDFSIPSGLMGRQWTLTEYYDAQNGYQDVSGSSNVTVIFTQKGLSGISEACEYRADVNHDAVDQLDILDIYTKRGSPCSAPDRYLDALQTVTHYHLEQNTLTLKADGQDLIFQ